MNKQKAIKKNKRINFRRKTLWKKITLCCLLPLIIAAVLIGFLSYDKAKMVAIETGKRNLSDAINRVDISLNMRSRMINGAMETIADSNFTLSALKGMNEKEGGATVRQLCDSNLSVFFEISNYVILEKDVILISKYDKSDYDADYLRNIFRMAYSDGMQKTVWSNQTKALNAEAERNVILIRRTIYDERGALIGVLVAEVNPVMFGSSLLSKQKILDYQRTFFLDRDKKLLFTDNTVDDELVKTVLAKYEEGKRAFSVRTDKTELYCCAQYNGMTGWLSFNVIPLDKLFSSADELWKYMVVLVFFCVLCAFLCLMILSIVITKPLATLNEGMKQMQCQNFEIQLKKTREDEIGELTDSFNYMARHIDNLIKQVYQVKIAQRTAEIEALQAQINPHFLYNTFDNINWMLIERNEMEISSIIVSLGRLMQYSMNMSVSLVPLKEEYRNVRDFLIIEQSRLEDRLMYQLELDPEIENFLVPKLILQPLVENSIKHGIVPSTHTAMLTIKSSRETDRIKIQINDDGVGMTEDELKHYNCLLDSNGEGETNIGVRNVTRRLQLHFNDNCKFIVESAEKTGTKLTLIIPIKGEEHLL